VLAEVHDELVRIGEIADNGSSEATPAA
jgi:hypothetical protein